MAVLCLTDHCRASSVAPSTSAAPTEEGPLSSVAAATSIPPSSSGVSLEDAPSEKSMELDYANNSTLTMLVLSPAEVVVATDVTTPTAPEAGSSGPSDTANAVLECWTDIVSNKEAEASKMDEQAG
ncbi:hypothetical protein C0989_005824 [Termitomyces sp. Mn162]|nr:hypothetical protein C0989_005824 [Termitomyces sp. Mn162]